VIVEVDPASAVPPYEQVRAQLAGMITAGSLPPGTRLPTIRALAGDLGLAVNTVARAYRELEAAQLVTTRVRHGTTVTRRGGAGLSETEVHTRLTEGARAYVALAHELGVPVEEAQAAVGEAFGHRHE
jgi:DNA-binding transcriptional regulator YhcF (GntR family)